MVGYICRNLFSVGRLWRGPARCGLDTLTSADYKRRTHQGKTLATANKDAMLTNDTNDDHVDCDLTNDTLELPLSAVGQLVADDKGILNQPIKPKLGAFYVCVSMVILTLLSTGVFYFPMYMYIMEQQ